MQNIISDVFLLCVVFFNLRRIVVVAKDNTNLDSNIVDTVEFKSLNKRHTFMVPLSRYPIMTWMEIESGSFPNTTSIESREIKVGDPLSILIHQIDKSQKYDVKVDECNAYDEMDYRTSKYRLKLRKKPEWTKLKEGNLTIVYANFTSFKFPDKRHVYLTCSIEFCYEVCRNKVIVAT